MWSHIRISLVALSSLAIEATPHTDSTEKSWTQAGYYILLYFLTVEEIPV